MNTENLNWTESEGKAWDGSWKPRAALGQARLRHARDNGRNKLSKERVEARDLPEMGVGLWWADRAKSYNSMPIKVQLITEMRAEGKV